MAATPMGRGFQLLLVALAMAAAGYARVTINPLQETMKSALAFNDNQLALLQGAALSLPMAIVAVPLGMLADRYSRVRILVVFTVLAIAGTVATALTSTFQAMFAARCVVGLATAVNPVTISLVSDLFQPAVRGRATMVVGFGQVVGMSAAFALGGALLTTTDPDGWRWAMLWLGCPLGAVALLLVAMREPDRVGLATEERSIQGVGQTLSRYWRVIAPLMAGIVVVEIALGAMLVWTAPAFSRSYALPPDRVGAVIATAMLVSGIVGPLTGGILADLSQRTGGPRRTMSVLCLLALLAMPAGLFPVMPEVVSATLLFAVFKIIIIAIAVMGLTLFTVALPNELRGLCVGILVSGTVLFSGILAPLMVSVVSGAIGGESMIGSALALICLGSTFLGAAAFAFGRRYVPRAAIT